MNRILVCDDDKDIVAALRIYLTAEGYEVLEAGNGRQALALAEQEPVSLVLMDIMMPEMDGFEATSLVRANPRFRYLPIIALTAHGMVGDREKCLKAGMNDHISKPIDPEALAEIASRWCRNTGTDITPQPAPL